MKLGVFDSGLGGLVIAKSIRDALPDIDMLYFGDTLHVPYGKRSDEAIFNYTKQAMEFMFAQGCNLIVVACNTASSAALRRLQQEWLPGAYPDRNIIGVIVPTLEAAIDVGAQKVGLIATNYLVRSGIYEEELKKLSPSVTLIGQATPLLVPLIEDNGLAWADDILRHYLSVFLPDRIDTLILGCTHYPFIKDRIAEIVGPDIRLLSQDEIVPDKLADYLNRHPEYSDVIDKNGRDEFYISDVTDNFMDSAVRIYGRDVKIQKASL